MSDSLVAEALAAIGGEAPLKQGVKLYTALDELLAEKASVLQHGEELTDDSDLPDLIEALIIEHGQDLSADIVTQIVGDVLRHWGVKGMKWGVRKDRGSVKKGKMDKPEDETTTTKSSGGSSPSSSRSSGPARKTVKQMSDQELRDALNRLQMEKQYAQLTAPQKANNIVLEVIKSSGTQVARNVATQLGTAYVSRALNVNLNKALPDAYRVPIKGQNLDGSKKDDD